MNYYVLCRFCGWRLRLKYYQDDPGKTYWTHAGTNEVQCVKAETVATPMQPSTKTP